MDLRNFVSKALLDIIGAVQDAQKQTPTGSIVPRGLAQNRTVVELGVSDIQSVEFEVAVKADERSGSEARLNVVAMVIGGGVKGESGKTGGHSATLKFKIPIRLPGARD